MNMLTVLLLLHWPSVVLKIHDQAHDVAIVLQHRVPAVRHATDGLIFTSSEAAYRPGTNCKV